jgi:hypothetical protein
LVEEFPAKAEGKYIVKLSASININHTNISHQYYSSFHMLLLFRVLLENLELTSSSSAPISITGGGVVITNCDIVSGKDGIIIQGKDSFPCLNSVKIKDFSNAGIVWKHNASGVMKHCEIANCGVVSLSQKLTKFAF